MICSGSWGWRWAFFLHSAQSLLNDLQPSSRFRNPRKKIVTTAITASQETASKTKHFSNIWNMSIASIYCRKIFDLWPARPANEFVPFFFYFYTKNTKGCWMWCNKWLSRSEVLLNFSNCGSDFGMLVTYYGAMVEQYSDIANGQRRRKCHDALAGGENNYAPFSIAIYFLNRVTSIR